jgi:hypothetical protein
MIFIKIFFEIFLHGVKNIAQGLQSGQTVCRPKDQIGLNKERDGNPEYGQWVGYNSVAFNGTGRRPTPGRKPPDGLKRKSMVKELMATMTRVWPSFPRALVNIFLYSITTTVTYFIKK